MPNEARLDTTRAVIEALEANDLMFKVERHDTMESIEVGFVLEHHPAHMLIACMDGVNSVSMRVIDGFIGVRPEHEEALLETINELNNNFRYTRFYLDDSVVILAADLSNRTPLEEIGKSVYELFMRMSATYNVAIPLLQQAVESVDEDD